MATIGDARSFSSDMIGVGIQFSLSTAISLGCLLAYELLRKSSRMQHFYSSRTRLRYMPTPPLSRKPLLWIRDVYRLDEKFYFIHVGLDAVMHLRFLKMCFTVVLVSCIVCNLILLPINYTLGTADGEDNPTGKSVPPSNNGTDTLFSGSDMDEARRKSGLHLFSLDHLDDKSNLFWIHMLALYFICGMIKYLLFRNTIDYVKMYADTLTAESEAGYVSTRTVLVEDIPKDLRSEAKLMEFFEDLNIGPVDGTTLVRKYSRLVRMLNKRKDLVDSLENNHLQLARGYLNWLREDTIKNPANYDQANNEIKTISAIGGSAVSSNSTSDSGNKESSEPDEIDRTIALAHNESKQFLIRWINWRFYREGNHGIDIDELMKERPGLIWNSLALIKRGELDRFQPLYKPTEVIARKFGSKLSDLLLFRKLRNKSVTKDGQVHPNSNNESDSDKPVVVRRAIDTNLRLLSKVDRKLQELRDLEKMPELYRPTNAAFVTFETQTAAHLAAQSFIHNTPHRMKVILAPEPRDVMWSTFLLSERTKFVRYLIVLAMCWTLIIIWLIPLTLILGLVSLEQLNKIQWFANITSSSPVVRGFITNNLPSILVSMFNSLLPIVLMAISQKQAFRSYSELEDTMITRHAWFALFNTVIFFCLGRPLLTSVISWVRSPVDLVETLSLVLVKQAEGFYLNYIIYTCVSHGLELAQLGFPLLFGWIGDNPLRLSTPRRTLRHQRPMFFAFYYYLAPQTVVFLITLLYAVVTPLILPFSLVYFGIGLIVFKHQFAYVYVKQYENHGRFWRHIVNYVCLGMILAIGVFLVMMLLKKAYIVAGFTAPLFVTSILYWVYLHKHWFKRMTYLPLSNMAARRHSSQHQQQQQQQQQQTRPAQEHLAQQDNPTSPPDEPPIELRNIGSNHTHQHRPTVPHRHSSFDSTISDDSISIIHSDLNQRQQSAHQPTDQNVNSSDLQRQQSDHDEGQKVPTKPTWRDKVRHVRHTIVDWLRFKPIQKAIHNILFSSSVDYSHEIRSTRAMAEQRRRAELFSMYGQFDNEFVDDVHDDGHDGVGGVGVDGGVDEKPEGATEPQSKQPSPSPPLPQSAPPAVDDSNIKPPQRHCIADDSSIEGGVQSSFLGLDATTATAVPSNPRPALSPMLTPYNLAHITSIDAAVLAVTPSLQPAMAVVASDQHSIVQRIVESEDDDRLRDPLIAATANPSSTSVDSTGLASSDVARAEAVRDRAERLMQVDSLTGTAALSLSRNVSAVNPEQSQHSRSHSRSQVKPSSSSYPHPQQSQPDLIIPIHTDIITQQQQQQQQQQQPSTSLLLQVHERMFPAHAPQAIQPTLAEMQDFFIAHQTYLHPRLFTTFSNGLWLSSDPFLTRFSADTSCVTVYEALVSTNAPQYQLLRQRVKTLKQQLAKIKAGEDDSNEEGKQDEDIGKLRAAQLQSLEQQQQQQQQQQQLQHPELQPAKSEPILMPESFHELASKCGFAISTAQPSQPRQLSHSSSQIGFNNLVSTPVVLHPRPSIRSLRFAPHPLSHQPTTATGSNSRHRSRRSSNLLLTPLQNVHTATPTASHPVSTSTTSTSAGNIMTPAAAAHNEGFIPAVFAARGSLYGSQFEAMATSEWSHHMQPTQTPAADGSGAEDVPGRFVLSRRATHNQPLDHPLATTTITTMASAADMMTPSRSSLEAGEQRPQMRNRSTSTPAFQRPPSALDTVLTVHPASSVPSTGTSVQSSVLEHLREQESHNDDDDDDDDDDASDSPSDSNSSDSESSDLDDD